jgi:outer membrane protein assembly factor BamB
MKTRSLFLLGAALLALAGSGRADHWPQWRGPNRDDVSTEKGLLPSWPKQGPKLLWTCREAGIGFSGPAVVGDHVYSLGADDKTESVYALDVNTGKKLWSADVGPLYTNGYGDGPRCTPTVDGDRLYVLGGEGDLVCVERATGKLLWKKNLVNDLGGGIPSWGYAESPLVDGDRVVCTPGGGQGAVAALDKKTGDVLWRSKDFTDGAQYASLAVGTAGGVRQYVQMTGQSVAGVAADDGRLLWRYQRNGPVAAVPTPIIHGDYVYVTSGYGAGCHLIKLVRSGKDFRAEEVYARDTMTNHHGGVVLVGKDVYGYSDGGGYVCQNFLSGKPVWQEKRKLGKGSLTCAGGQLYCYSETGTVALIDASPAGWQEHGRFDIPEKTQVPRQYEPNIWTHPVVADGRLYLRDQDLLFCFDVKDHGDGSP